ncbi:MAG: hypothetical protein WCP89_03490, partial [archaeon]
TEQVKILYPFRQEINRGFNAVVYWISDSHVVKVPLSDQRDIGYLVRELDVQKELHGRGISVPSPCEIVPILLGNKPYKGLVMERIHGWSLRDHPDSGMIEAYYAEVCRARQMGFVPKDLGAINALWDNRKSRVTLIDFDGWELNKK